MMWSKILGLALLPAAANAFASTDTPSDVDPAQSGYIPNHNVDPTKIGTWTLNVKNTYNSLEGFYAKPLVYTPTGATSEQVIIVSSQNIVRVVDGKTGALLNSRTLNPPFQSSDTLGCGDIPNTIGITGTPYIDSATDIMYFYSKGYQNGQAGPQGAINGQFLFYAVHLPSLADVAGFPISIEGHYADNDHTRYFVGGTVNQRASLTSIGNTIIAGFGGHCDNFNYTGMLVAVSKTTGVGVTSIIAMEANPGAPQPQELNIAVQGGGKAGIWQSGFGLAADAANSRIFFVTGNARGNGDNGGGVPVSGLGKPISTLQQATCSFTVDANGVLHQADYFEPYEYTTLNGGDRDFGSSGAALLDPYFSGGGVQRMVVAGGKSGKIYIMNADNLGGFANGGGGADAVIQTIVEGTSLLSGVASYPAEGGYIYFATTSSPLTCYSFNSATGKFTFAGQSALTLAGVGAPVVTSLNGQAGTAVVWVADVNQGLVAYHAIPVGGVLQPITFLATGRLMKYQRPSFGNARVYTFENNVLYGLGAPTSPPPAMTCTPSPLSFGPVTVGQTSTIQVTCKAGAAVTMNGCTSSLSTFQCQPFAGTVAAGSSFQFGVTMNLTAAAIEADRLATPSNQIVPGSAVAALNLYNSAGVAQANIQASGTVIASGGFVVAGASTVDFAGITACQTSAGSVTLSNKGATVLTINGLAWKDLKATNGPFNNITAGSPTIIGNQFASATFPTINQQIAPGATITIPLTFAPKVAGSDASLVGFWTDGGYTDVMLVGSASGTCPVSSTSSSVKSSTSSTGPSSNPASTTTSKSSTLQTITTSSTVTATAGPIGAYNYQGCYRDIPVGNALPLLFRNNSVTPELCEAYVASLAAKPTPTVLPYFYVEYHRECYGGSVWNFGSAVISSLTGVNACTDICSGSIGAATTGTAKCGGSKMFNLYAATTPVLPSVPITVSV